MGATVTDRWLDEPARRRDRTRRSAGGHRPPGRPRRRTRGSFWLALGLVILLVVVTAVLSTSGLRVLPFSGSDEVGRSRDFARELETQSLDGSGNNRRHPQWGQAGIPYTRVAEPNYADGIAAPVEGPNSRWVSNRVFNDVHQNVFSERDVTQWVFTWGQFLDHTIGLRDDAGEVQDMAFPGDDPLEEFANTLGTMSFTRSAAAPGTGVTSPREQVNTVSSYVDAWAVYGGSPERLDWLREGPIDGDPTNNSARLRLPEGELPRRDALGDVTTAPVMQVNGRLMGTPDRAVVAGDVRANENIALTATHTLFAREHNRIVGLLPAGLSEEQRFQIARRVVIAEQQWITYREFLPAVGVQLPRYDGYDPRVDTTLSNEFATVGYRAHSMIHGEIEVEADAGRYTAEDLEALEGAGVEVEVSPDGAEVALAVPLSVAFFNPDLVGQLGLGPLLQGIGLEAQYNNDEMIDNQLRSVLFQIPVPGNNACLDGEGLPECFEGVLDLGAVDIERGRDHGMPSYNDLRAAYGLEPATSFAEITGEAGEEWPADPELTPGGEIDDPDSLDFTRLVDGDGNELPLEVPEGAEEPTPVDAERRTPVAARLKAAYGTVDQVDAFVGMLAEPHVEGTELGELQLAIWTRQFQALRDGDRFFFGNDPGLRRIRDLFGIDYRRTLGQVIAANSDIPAEELADNVFFTAESQAADGDDDGWHERHRRRGDGGGHDSAPTGDVAVTPELTPGLDDRRRPAT